MRMAISTCCKIVCLFLAFLSRPLQAAETGSKEEIQKFRLASQVASKLNPLIQSVQSESVDWTYLDSINKQIQSAGSSEEVSLILLARDLVLDCHGRITAVSGPTCLRQVKRYGPFASLVGPINLGYFSKISRKESAMFILCAGILISSNDLKETLACAWAVAKQAKVEFQYH